LQIVRALHRDVGYLMLGLTLIFALSGIVMVYRDAGLLQHQVRVETRLAPGMDASALGQALAIRDFRVDRTEGSVVHFRGGTYDRSTGLTVRTQRGYVFPLDRFASLHKVASRHPIHWLVIAYGVLLSFLAISSFWMFRVGSRPFRRGMYLASAGIALALLLLFLSPRA